MYAVVRTGGKQYRVTLGDNLEVEKLAGDVGDSIVLDDVLMVARDEGIQIGRPTVEGASVTARITGQHRGEKILVFRYRPKKRVRVRRGHRQFLTRLQILKISGDGYEYVKEEQEAAPEPVAEVVEPVVEEVEAAAAVAAITETDAVVEAATEEVADADESAIDAVKETVAKAGDAVEDVSDTVGDALEAVSDKASDAAEAVGDMAGDAVEAVSDVAGDTLDAATDMAGDAVEAVGDAASDALDAATDAAGDAVDAVAKNLKGLMGRGEKSGDVADADEDKKEEG